MKKGIILLVVLIGFFIRVYKIASIPPGITMDESSIGYNAFSILETGKDEYNKPFPLFFRSFADYKMPVYFYLDIPFIKLFGLNVFSLRLPSALLGCLSGYLIFRFILDYFDKKRWLLAFLGLIIFEFSPWSILYSRVAFESNVGFFFLMLGVYLQMLAFKKEKWFFLFISSFAYIISVYSYHTERVLALIFVLAVPFILSRTKQNKAINKKILITSILFFLVISFPQYYLLGKTAGSTRIQSTAILKESEINQFVKKPSFGLFLVDRQFSLYSAYFSPRNLFFDPNPVKTRSFPEISVFYFWMVIPYLLGLYLLLKSEDKKFRNLILFYLLVSPLPASITGDPFETLRALPLIFPLSIVIALGIEKFIYLKKKVYVPTLVFLAIISLTLLYRNLFYLLPFEKYSQWNYGYRQISEEINKIKPEKVLFDDTIGDNYAEFLFFLKYPPEKFQKEQNQINLADYYKSANWKNTFEFGGIEIRPLIWKKDIYENKLIIATPLAISDNQAKEHFLTKSFVIIGLDNEVVFNGFITDPEKKIEDDKRKLKLLTK